MGISYMPSGLFATLVGIVAFLLASCTPVIPEHGASPYAGSSSTAPQAIIATATIEKGSSSSVGPTPTVVLPPVATPNPTNTPTATSSRSATIAAPSSTPTAPPSSSVTGPKISGELAYRHVQELADSIGSRPAGSQANAAARRYIAEQLRSFGYDVTEQAFPFAQFIDRGSSLDIIAPELKELRANAFYYSASGEAKGELMDVGLGRPSDLSTRVMAGKIALIGRGELTFQEKVENVARAGAIAAVIYNNQPGNFRGALRGHSSFPVISLSQEDGRYLLGLLRQGPVQVRVKVEATEQQGTGYNVIATRAGARTDTVVVGAHYDSVEAGPGANDNASGVATMLEVARVMAVRGYTQTLRIIAFDAEELGLLGSRSYVRSLAPEEQGQIVAMINLDMVGVGTDARYGGSRELVDAALHIAGELGISADELGGSLNSASDHASFAAVGIRSLFLHRVEDPNYHTANDKAQYVEARHLESAAQVTIKLLDQLAMP